MSDGPHRSLPMRLAWRRVAERGDTPAFTAEEISRALVPALEQDCRDGLSPEFLAGVRNVMRQPSLFNEDLVGRLNTLRPEAGAGLGSAFLDNVAFLSASDANNIAVLQDALEGLLVDLANRGARQVEEHYLRRSPAPRATNVRRRLEDGIACTDFAAIAVRVLSLDTKSALTAPLRLKGIDDGVSLR